MAELKPCPFCGGEAVIHETEYATESAWSNEAVPKNARIIREAKYPGNPKWVIEYRRPAWTPQCSDPSCIGRIRHLFKSEQEAADAWNRRAGNG